MATPQFSNQLQSFRADTGKSFKPRSGFKNWFSGNPEMFRQAPKYSPQIQQSVNDLLSQGFQNLQNPYQGFENIANQAENQYNTQTIPSIAERFAAVPGGQRSSAFQAALGGSGEDFQRGLAAMKEGFGQQNRQQALGQIGFGLQNQPEFMYSPKQRGWLEGLLGPLLGGGNYQGAMGGQGQAGLGSFLQNSYGGQSEGLQQILKFLPLLLGI